MKTAQTNVSENSNTELSYQLFTNPSPVQVSSSNTTESVVIKNSVTTGGKTVYCNKIVIVIPKGTDGASLTDVQPTATANSTKWTLAGCEVKLGLDIGLIPDQQYFVCIFQTVSPSDNLIDYDLIFSISANVNRMTGTFQYSIIEFSGTSDNPQSFTEKETSISVQKTELQFYLKNFVATAPSAPTVPLTQFANTVDIKFSWESSGNYFQLYAKGDATPIYQGTAPEFLLSKGVTRSTTFFLVATATGDPNNNTGGLEPIQLYDALTLTISNPDVTPNSVIVARDAIINGDLAINGTPTNPSSDSPLTIKGRGGGTYKFGKGKLCIEGGDSTGDLHFESTNFLYLNYFSKRHTIIGGVLQINDFMQTNFKEGAYDFGKDNICIQGGNKAGNLHFESTNDLFLNYYSKKRTEVGGNLDVKGGVSAQSLTLTGPEGTTGYTPINGGALRVPQGKVVTGINVIYQRIDNGDYDHYQFQLVYK